MSLPRTEATAIRKATGYTPSQWTRKLNQAYGEAKRRHDGDSLTIYGDVSDMLDILEGWEPMPAGVNELARQLDGLIMKVRTA